MDSTSELGIFGHNSQRVASAFSRSEVVAYGAINPEEMLISITEGRHYVATLPILYV